jgi:hypothetical protein
MCKPTKLISSWLSMWWATLSNQFESPLEAAIGGKTEAVRKGRCLGRSSDTVLSWHGGIMLSCTCNAFIM